MTLGQPGPVLQHFFFQRIDLAALQRVVKSIKRSCGQVKYIFVPCIGPLQYHLRYRMKMFCLTFESAGVPSVGEAAPLQYASYTSTFVVLFSFLSISNYLHNLGFGPSVVHSIIVLHFLPSFLSFEFFVHLSGRCCIAVARKLLLSSFLLLHLVLILPPVHGPHCPFRVFSFP